MTATAAPGTSAAFADEGPRYEPVPGWPNLPYGMTFGSEAASVAVDADDRVLVFCRGPVPVMIFDRDGSLLGSWGEGEFGLAHAATFDVDGNVWLTDLRHVVEKRALDGTLLLSLGERGSSAPPYSNEPFNMPTDLAEDPLTRDLFVTDGYRNAAVHRFSPDGALIRTFGSVGTEVGALGLPHGVAFLDDERIVVCDRENSRLQIFSLDGEPLDAWHVYFPQMVRTVRRPGQPTLIYVGEGPPSGYMRHAPGFGCRVLIFDDTGRRVGVVGRGGWGFEADRFTAIHGIAVDSLGDLYVAEAPHATLLRFYREDVPPGELVSLRKWSLIA